jgi:hypothetical protein
MPDVYHQKVWKTSYQQAITTQILANVYNCIGSNCINQSEGDSLAWVGLKLNKSNKIDMRTCGSNGNNWQFSDNQLSGISFAIIPVQNSHSMKMINDLSTCDMPQKIICVSI